MRHSASLQRQLPLLVSGLLAAAVVAMALIASSTFGKLAVTTIGGRLSERARYWAELMGRPTRDRVAKLELVAADPSLGQLFDCEGQSRDAALAVLKPLKAGNTTVALEVTDTNGRVLVCSG